MKNSPWHSRAVLILALLLPVYFAASALGTKFGLWSWQTGLGTLIIRVGPILLGIVAFASLISLVVAALKKPRKGWLLSVIALFVPITAFVLLAMVRSQAGAVPAIHDVSTDTANPPGLSAAAMAARTESGANPINDYQTPLGELEPWKGGDPELASKSHAQLITDAYADLAPLPLGSTSKADAVAAVAAAMEDMGFANVVADTEAGRVDGVAETFWFGFKDDVTARVSDSQIDFRSVSRVGLSDLGANADRIEELRKNVAARLQ
ncbi:MAG: DUF1499 domain-containing protein [Pseudomonadota bacterium]